MPTIQVGIKNRASGHCQSKKLSNISQGSVATRSRSGWIFNDEFITNLPLCLKVKEFTDKNTVPSFWHTAANGPALFTNTSSSSSSPCGLSSAGSCHSYERAPHLTILHSTIGSYQTNAEWCWIGFTIQSQGWCGLPDRRFHSLGKGATQVLKARLWSIDGSARVMWPKNLRQVVLMMCVSGGWSVRRRTSSLQLSALQEMHTIRHRHHWSVVKCIQIPRELSGRGLFLLCREWMTGRMKTR